MLRYSVDYSWILGLRQTVCYTYLNRHCKYLLLTALGSQGLTALNDLASLAWMCQSQLCLQTIKISCF